MLGAISLKVTSTNRKLSVCRVGEVRLLSSASEPKITSNILMSQQHKAGFQKQLSPTRILNIKVKQYSVLIKSYSIISDLTFKKRCQIH